MRTSILVPCLSLVCVSYAWPWPVGGIQQIDRRQDTQATTANIQPGTSATASSVDQTTIGPQATTNSPSPTTAGAALSSSASIKTATFLSSTAGSGSNGGDGSVGSNDTVFSPVDPPGGVAMLNPNPLSTTQYYKIGDFVTFAWNYTSLQATPTAVNVVASCSANQHAYTLAANQSVAQATGQVVWDTAAYQSAAQVPLLTNEYNLVIWDAAKPINAVPSAGYLAAYSQFQFGMYTPQPYSNLSNFNCATCRNGAGSLPQVTLTFILVITGTTVASFTWFASGLSL